MKKEKDLKTFRTFAFAVATAEHDDNSVFLFLLWCRENSINVSHLVRRALEATPEFKSFMKNNAKVKAAGTKALSG